MYNTIMIYYWKTLRGSYQETPAYTSYQVFSALRRRIHALSSDVRHGILNQEQVIQQVRGIVTRKVYIGRAKKTRIFYIK